MTEGKVYNTITICSDDLALIIQERYTMLWDRRQPFQTRIGTGENMYETEKEQALLVLVSWDKQPGAWPVEIGRASCRERV